MADGAKTQARLPLHGGPPGRGPQKDRRNVLCLRLYRNRIRAVIAAPETGLPVISKSIISFGFWPYRVYYLP